MENKPLRLLVGKLLMECANGNPWERCGQETGRPLFVVCFFFVNFALAPCRAAGVFEPDRIILNLTETPDASMAVTWRTQGAVKEPKAQIAVAEAYPDLEDKAWTVAAVSETVALGTGKTVSAQSVVFQSLKPETVYVYRVGGNDVWSERNQFRTAAAPRKTGKPPHLKAPLCL